MNRARWMVILLLLPAVAAAQEPVLATQLETETFKMMLPPGWVETSRDAKSISLAGPGSETAYISIARVAGNGTQDELEKARLRLRDKLRETIESGAQSASYLTAQAVQEKVVANGNTVISSKLRTRDRQAFVHQYGVLGPRAALLTTVKGQVADIFSANMFEYFIITTVQWK